MPLETDRKLVGIGLEILVPISISREPLEAFLRASGYSQTELAEKWYKSKSDELAYVGVTSAIIAGLFGSAFTWPAAESATWPTLACWYGGLMFIIASIATATQQSIILHRFHSHEDPTERLKDMLGYQCHKPNHWHPRLAQLFIWQIPIMMLRFGVYMFLIGMSILLWNAAYNQGDWSSSDWKIAIIFSAIAVFAFFCYFLSFFFAYTRAKRIHTGVSAHSPDAREELIQHNRER